MHFDLPIPGRGPENRTMLAKTSAFFILMASSVAILSAEQPDLKPIFSGSDFSGWKLPAGNEEMGWFKATDGILKLQSDPAKKGSMLFTEKAYRDFLISFEFKFGEGVVDSGIFLRNQDQIQLGISGSLKRDMTGSPYIPGKKYPVEATASKDVFKPADWNLMKIEVRGPRYLVWLNGTQVLDYTSETAIAEGPIGIQLHPGNVMAIDYRNIKLAELP
jgi:hypothetical protein